MGKRTFKTGQSPWYVGYKKHSLRLWWREHTDWVVLVPLASLPAQRLLAQVRPWIEPEQSYEENQLGLSSAFLNSLRLTWCMALLADAAVLLRTKALLNTPNHRRPLHGLMTHQSLFDFGSIDQSDY